MEVRCAWCSASPQARFAEATLSFACRTYSTLRRRIILHVLHIPTVRSAQPFTRIRPPSVILTHHRHPTKSELRTRLATLQSPPRAPLPPPRVKGEDTSTFSHGRTRNSHVGGFAPGGGWRVRPASRRGDAGAGLERIVAGDGDDLASPLTAIWAHSATVHIGAPTQRTAQGRLPQIRSRTAPRQSAFLRPARLPREPVSSASPSIYMDGHGVVGGSSRPGYADGCWNSRTEAGRTAGGAETLPLVPSSLKNPRPRPSNVNQVFLPSYVDDDGALDGAWTRAAGSGGFALRRQSFRILSNVCGVDGS